MWLVMDRYNILQESFYHVYGVGVLCLSGGRIVVAR